jgi:hypothetical protein
MSDDLFGECSCGSVKYRVADDFAYALNCHCSQCRRATGAAFKPLAGIDRQKLTLVEGEDRLWIYGDEAGAHDVRCARCGSLLYSVVQNGDYAHVAMGTLTNQPSIRPSMHIFTASKAPWEDIADDLPQHEGFPGAD